MKYLFILFILAACSTTKQTEVTTKRIHLNSFKTDGCSVYPDSSLIEPNKWLHCCIAHDMIYWSGGSLKEKHKCDEELKNCIGSSNAVDLPWEWGYGWKRNTGYEPLTTEDIEQVQAKFGTVHPEIMKHEKVLDRKQMKYILEKYDERKKELMGDADP